MITRRNRCHSPVNGVKTMAVIGIVVLLAAGLWLAAPL